MQTTAAACHVDETPWLALLTEKIILFHFNTCPMQTLSYRNFQSSFAGNILPTHLMPTA
jgi:hypothetical protein